MSDETKTPTKEELPLGTDWNELLVSTIAPEEAYIIFNKKRWGPFRIKPMGWSKKNKLLNACTTYTSDGSSSFNWDRWWKECIYAILIPPPGFQMNEVYLTSLHEKFGAALEKLCPQPFDIQKLVDQAKKELGNSEAPTSKDTPQT